MGNEFGIFITKSKPLEKLLPWLEIYEDKVVLKIG